MKAEIKCSGKAEKGALNSDWGRDEGRKSGMSHGNIVWHLKALTL